MKHFPCGVGCMACKQNRFGILYTPWIHTAKDTVLHSENIDVIADGAVRFVRAIGEPDVKS